MRELWKLMRQRWSLFHSFDHELAPFERSEEANLLFISAAEHKSDIIDFLLTVLISLVILMLTHKCLHLQRFVKFLSGCSFAFPLQNPHHVSHYNYNMCRHIDCSLEFLQKPLKTQK